MYNELYAAWQREIDSAELVPLPTGFYSKVSDYASKIREEAGGVDRKTLRAELLEHEMRNVEHLVRELTRIRCRKLRKKIAENQKIPSEALAPEEEKMCSGLLDFTQAYNALVANLLHGQSGKVETNVPEETRRRVALRFVKPIPAIVGSDMKTYGPFAAEDVASLPVENARILVKQGLAALIDIS